MRITCDDTFIDVLHSFSIAIRLPVKKKYRSLTERDRRGVGCSSTLLLWKNIVLYGISVKAACDSICRLTGELVFGLYIIFFMANIGINNG